MITLLVTLGALVFALCLLAAWLLMDRASLLHRAAAAESRRDELQQRLDAADLDEARLDELQIEAARLNERLESREREHAAQLDAIQSQRQEQAERDENRLREISAQYQEKLEALAAKALQQSNEQFLKLAEESFTRHRAAANTELDEKRRAFTDLITPITNTLKQTDEKISSFDKARIESQAKLREHLQSLSSHTLELSSQTSRLVHSLRAPQVRGRWGEMALRNVVELAGMTEHCDFSTQTTVTDNEESRFRPDMTIRLPGQRTLVVDAKAPLQAYLDAIEADTEDKRSEHLRAHARQVRGRIDELAGKRYQRQFDHSLDFVVLFVPGDQFLSAALRQDPTLLEYAASRHVVLTTPATLIALLKAVSFGWTQASLAEDAAEILALGKQLHERVAVMTEHLGNVGKFLSRTVKAYNNSVGSYQSRVLPAARKLEEHHVRSTKDLTPPEEVSLEPRTPARAGAEEEPALEQAEETEDRHTPMLIEAKEAAPAPRKKRATRKKTRAS